MTVTLTQFTDPLCTWCWGAEPVLRRIEETYGDQVEFAFVMGGLVADFESFHDVANGISEPADVVPHWEMAADRHGMPVDATVWHVDPPKSSYPASEAYEAATFQGRDVASRYLRRLREAVAAGGRNVAKRSVLVDLAGDVDLDVPAFEAALNGGRARAAFEEDRKYARERGATTFPTFHVEGDDSAEWRCGFQAFESLADAIEAADPGIERRSPRAIREFLAAHDRVATQEVAEVYGLSHGEALERISALEDQEAVRRLDRGTGFLWESILARDDSSGDPVTVQRGGSV